MRIHTNDVQAVREAIREATASMPGVYAEHSAHGSRIRAGAVELRLEGNGRTGGQWGGTDNQSATWDEWGVVLQAIFDADPLAVAGGQKCPTYAGREHYEWATGRRFVAFRDWPRGLPTDTHKQHRWEYMGDAVTRAYSVHACTRCSAVKRYLLDGSTAREILEGASIVAAVDA